MTTAARIARGFTLIEVMVALLVLGIALPALMSQVLSQVEASAHLRDKTLAAWVASDQLAQLRLQHFMQGTLPVGIQTGERELAQQTWHWTMQIEATELPGIVRQTVTVGLQAEEGLASFSGYSYPRLRPGSIAP